MEKKALKINDYGGGLNDFQSQTDIKENQSPNLINVDITKDGNLLPIGGFQDSHHEGFLPATTNGTANHLHKDFNCQPFKVDINRTNNISPDTFITYMGRERQIYGAWNSNSYTWETIDSVGAGIAGFLDGAGTSGNTTSADSIDMVQGRGAVRYINGNFAVANTAVGDAGNTKLWFGHIKRDFADTEISVDDYFILPANLYTPDANLFDTGSHNNNWDSTPTPPNAGKFLLEVDEGLSSESGEEGYEINTPAHGGSLTVKDSVFYCTFTYDGNQETLPFKCGPHIQTISGNAELAAFDGSRAFRMRLNWYPYDLANGAIEPIQFKYGGPRITHVNIYRNIYSEGDTSSFYKGNYEYVTTFDLQRGWKQDSGNYANWTGPTANVMQCETGWFSSSFTMTYRMRSGVNPSEDTLDVRWKTSAKLRNTLYVANVFQKDEFGVDKHYPDRMMKSIPSRWDVFPSVNTIDVATDDGESIIALAQYAGKILQFKEDTLNVINATKEFEFLESSIKNMGIDFPNAICELKAGLCFANKNGVFIYNGKEVINLNKDTRDKQKYTRWYTAESVSDAVTTDIIVSYIPRYNKIIIHRILDTEPGLYYESFFTYIFDIDQQAWMQCIDLNPISGVEGTHFTNGVHPSYKLGRSFIYDNDLYILYNKYDESHAIESFSFAKWKNKRGANSGDATTTLPLCNWTYYTKKFDFGFAAQTKKFKKVSLSYKVNPGNDFADGTAALTYNIYFVYENSVTPDTVELFPITGQSGIYDTSSGNFMTVDFVAREGEVSTGKKISLPFRMGQLKIEGSDVTNGLTLMSIDNIEIVYTEKKLK